MENPALLAETLSRRIEDILERSSSNIHQEFSSMQRLINYLYVRDFTIKWDGGTGKEGWKKKSVLFLI